MMTRLQPWQCLAGLLLLLGPSAALAASTNFTVTIGAGPQTIVSISPTAVNLNVATACADGTQVTPLTATMSNNNTPPFSGTWSVTGDAHFRISGSNLVCNAVGGMPVPPNTYTPTVTATPTNTAIAPLSQGITVTISSGGAALLVFNHGADLANAGASPYTTATYNTGASPKLLVAGLEFAGCTAPAVTYSGVAMTLPTGAITNTGQGGNNPLAMFYLINPPTTGTFVVTCSGASFLYLIAADYADAGAVPTFQGAANTVDGVVETTYTSSFTNPTANNLILLMAGNIGGTTAITGGTGATLRQSNAFNSDALFDSNAIVATGAYAMTTTVPNNASGGPFSNSKQTHVFMAFNAGGPPPPPAIGVVSLATPNFTVPASGLISVINNTCPNGGCSAITHTLVQSGGSCNATNGADNALFSISGRNLNAAGTLTAARTYVICDRADLAGATDTPVFTPLNATGSTPSANSVVLLDNKLNSMGQTGIFTGSPPDRTDTVVANLSNANHTTATYAMCGSHADNAKFKIVGTSGQWVVDSRPGPWLESNGAQGVQSGGFTIGVSVTDGSGTSCTTITLGDPPYNAGSKNPRTVSGGDIAGAIANANPSTEYVYIPPGSYGGFTMRNGVDVVSATTQNHINGGTSRAAVGAVTPASNATLYGVSMTDGICINGTTNFSWINTVMDLSSGSQACQNAEYYYTTNNTGLHIGWNNFAHGVGSQNPGGAGNDHNSLWEHNVYYFSSNDNEANDLCGSDQIEYSANFQDQTGAAHNPDGMHGTGGLEWQGGGCNNRGNITLRDHYCINNSPGANHSFCWSLVGGWQNVQVLQIYCEGDPREDGCSLEANNQLNPPNVFRVFQSAFGNVDSSKLSVWENGGCNNVVVDHAFLVFNNACNAVNSQTFIAAPPWAAGAN